MKPRFAEVVDQELLGGIAVGNVGHSVCSRKPAPSHAVVDPGSAIPWLCAQEKAASPPSDRKSWTYNL